MLAPNSVAPNATLLNGIIAGLVQITQQIQGIGQTYPQVPDGPPPENSVIYVLKNIDLSTPEDGLIRWDVTYEIQHMFQRTNLSDVLTTAYSYIQPWVNVLSCLQNSSLNDFVIETYPTNVKLQGFSFASLPYIAITNTVRVITDQVVTR